MSKAQLPALVISTGQTISNALGINHLRWLSSLTILPPAALTGTITIEVTNKRNPESTDWVTLQSAGSDINPAAGKAVTLTDVPFIGLRLKSNAAEVASREFRLVGSEQA